MGTRGLCRLCERQRDLEESHILPKFVIRWQRETSVTPLRDSENPNQRVQDGTKLPFLCSECEDLFQQFETPFANEVFHPAHRPLEDLPQQVSYRRFGLKFAVSVSWRVLRYWSEMPRFEKLVSPEKRAVVGRALRTWSEFLLGRLPNPAEFEQHVLPLSFVEKPIEGQSPSFNRYAVRAVGHAFEHSSEIMYAYSKLGRLALFGMVPPYPRVPGWRNTKLHVNKGSITLRNSIIEIPEPIADFLNDHAEHAAKALSSVSPRQKAKIQASFNQAMATSPNDELFRALIRDYELFGAEALNRKFDDDDRNA